MNLFRFLTLFLLILGSNVSAQTQSSDKPSLTIPEDLLKQITYAEGKSLRGSPTTAVPAGTQFCGPNSEMATDADKQEACTETAKVIASRYYCWKKKEQERTGSGRGLEVGDGHGTAEPESPPAKPLASQKSSWKMAGKAAEDALSSFNAKSDQEKNADCDKEVLFYHQCYCCQAQSQTHQTGQTCQIIELDTYSDLASVYSAGSGESDESAHFDQVERELLDETLETVLKESGYCLANPLDKGCPKNGNITDAASYARIPCPGCPYSALPTGWGSTYSIRRVGGNMYDPVSGCWNELVIRTDGYKKKTSDASN